MDLSTWLGLIIGIGGILGGQVLEGDANCERGSRAKRRDPFAIERAGRTDQDPSGGGVHDAHSDFGGGMLPVAMAAGDDFDVTAWTRENRFHHRSR